MELLLIFLLFGGGFLFAVIFMYKATKHGDDIVRTLIYSTLVFGCLFAQRSCWSAAADFGRATGGNGGTAGEDAVTLIMVLWGVWTIVLIYGGLMRRKIVSKESDQPERDTESLLNESKRVIREQEDSQQE